VQYANNRFKDLWRRISLSLLKIYEKNNLK
jgi:hypothetical protein